MKALPPLRHAAALAAMLFSCGLLPGNPASEDLKRYKIASAIVDYTVSGSQSGTETLVFDQFGMREAKRSETVIRVAGQTIETRTLTIFDHGSTTTVDLVRRTATKIPTPMWSEIVEATKREGGDMTDLGTAMIRRMGAEKIGEESVAGKPCVVWRIQSLGSKSWVWNGIVLRQETSLAGQTIRIEATSVKENAAIPEERFALPPGITATEGANPIDALRQLREKMKR